MKKKTKAKTPAKKLQLRKERVRELKRESLDKVVGGADPNTGGCATTQFDIDQV